MLPLKPSYKTLQHLLTSSSSFIFQQQFAREQHNQHVQEYITFAKDIFKTITFFSIVFTTNEMTGWKV